MRKRRFIWFVRVLFCLVLLFASCCLYIHSHYHDFARDVGTEEQQLRIALVTAAEDWLGCKESDGSHRPIIDIYNSHVPLARDYAVTYSDAWCSAFVSTVAIQCDLTDIIPTECGCDCHIDLFMELGCWEEDDDHVPLPGDYIFYHWDCGDSGDCTHWSDHVGIVTGTIGRYIFVIEGNRNNDVSYRVLPVDDPSIRGYGLPDYTSKCK